MMKKYYSFSFLYFLRGQKNKFYLIFVTHWCNFPYLLFHIKKILEVVATENDRTAAAIVLLAAYCSRGWCCDSSELYKGADVENIYIYLSTHVLPFHFVLSLPPFPRLHWKKLENSQDCFQNSNDITYG